MKNNLPHIKLIFALLCTVSSFISAQAQVDTDIAIYNKANDYYQYEEFEKAAPLFEQLAERFPNNAHFNYKAGYCFYMSAGMRNRALPFFLNAEKKISPNFSDKFSEKNAPEETLLFIAKIYHENYEFDKSIATLEKLQATNNTKFDEEIEQLLKHCKVGKEFLSRPLDIEVMQIGGGINSIYDEHSPVLSADLKTMIFTSKRKGTGNQKDKNGQYHEDIYISKLENGKWTPPKSISKNINTTGHEASVGLSIDGRTLFIYKHNHGGDIYQSTYDNGEWSKPKKLGRNINTRYRETHASLSADGNTLYFTSNRRGGFGGMDIYKSQKVNGKWGKAVNLGSEINTKGNEEGPYIHSDNETLFFSSDTHKGMGGYDLFVSQKKMENGIAPKI